MLAAMLISHPATATSVCNVLKGDGGFVPLRSAPADDAPVIVHMREDDEVRVLGARDDWREVMHWHGRDRHDEIARANVRHGWVRWRDLGGCG
jgi:hypothetical protein